MQPGDSPVTHLVAVLSHPEEVRTAFPWAVSLARQWSLPLTLLHIVDPVSTRELAENARVMAEDMLALLATSPDAAGLAITTMVETGMPEAIIPAIAEQDAGAIFVLSAGQHGTFARALLRRGRENVIHHLRSPFVFLPPATIAPRQVERAVAGIDGSEIARRAVELARALLGETPITEVEVLEPGGLPSSEYLAARPAISESNIRLRGRAELVLLAAARVQDAGLIVVGRHGTTGLFGRYLGGTAEWLSLNADRPVLIVPRSPGRSATSSEASTA